MLFMNFILSSAFVGLYTKCKNMHCVGNIMPAVFLSQQDTRTRPDLPKLDLHVLPIYKLGVTGRGVRVVVLDDGIEYTHDDLKDNYVSLCRFLTHFSVLLQIPDRKPRKILGNSVFIIYIHSNEIHNVVALIKCLLVLRCQLYMFRTVTVHPQELLCRYCMCRLWYVLIRPAGTTF